jgi:hypothetical protein
MRLSDRHNITLGPIGPADKLTLVGLVVTITVTGIYPFIQSPLLDYRIRDAGPDEKDIKTFKVDVHNYGLSPAKDVVISIDSYKAKFVNMTSKPILPIIQNISNKTGAALFGIQVLPPFSDTSIVANLNTTVNQVTNLTAYVRSDERVGYHDTIPTAAFYLGLSSIYIISSVTVYNHSPPVVIRNVILIRRLFLYLVPPFVYVFLFTTAYFAYYRLF